jgi:hypothetical protein
VEREEGDDEPGVGREGVVVRARDVAEAGRGEGAVEEAGDVDEQGGGDDDARAGERGGLDARVVGRRDLGGRVRGQEGGVLRRRRVLLFGGHRGGPGRGRGERRRRRERHLREVTAHWWAGCLCWTGCAGERMDRMGERGRERPDSRVGRGLLGRKLVVGKSRPQSFTLPCICRVQVALAWATDAASLNLTPRSGYDKDDRDDVVFSSRIGMTDRHPASGAGGYSTTREITFLCSPLVDPSLAWRALWPSGR